MKYIYIYARSGVAFIFPSFAAAVFRSLVVFAVETSTVMYFPVGNTSPIVHKASRVLPGCRSAIGSPTPDNFSFFIAFLRYPPSPPLVFLRCKALHRQKRDSPSYGPPLMKMVFGNLIKGTTIVNRPFRQPLLFISWNQDYDTCDDIYIYIQLYRYNDVSDRSTGALSFSGKKGRIFFLYAVELDRHT